MPLQESAVDLPPLGGDERLQLAVRHPPRLLGTQPRYQPSELLLRHPERLLIDNRLCFHALGALPKATYGFGHRIRTSSRPLLHLFTASKVLGSHREIVVRKDPHPMTMPGTVRPSTIEDR